MSHDDPEMRPRAGAPLALEKYRSGSASSRSVNPERARWGSEPRAPERRAEVRGKFLFRGGSKLYVRGVAYGTFSPDEDGVFFPAVGVVGRDFAAMAANGINTVRTYTVPPCWLLDLADRHGLSVIVGIPWEQHVAFL